MTDVNIDYSALENYNFRSTLTQATKKTLNSKRYIIINLLWALISIPYLFLVILIPVESQEVPYGVLSYFPLLIIIWTWYYFYKIRSEKIKKFAESNNWTLRSYDYGESLPTAVASKKLGNGVSDILEMTINGVRWDLFCLDWPGQKRQVFTIFRKKLDKDISPMILDSMATQGFLTIPHGWKRVDLEGNFAQNFKLYIPEGSQTNVLSYMAPDLMQLLVQNNKLSDIEISNGQLFAILDNDSRNVNSLKTIIPTLLKINDKLS